MSLVLYDFINTTGWSLEFKLRINNTNSANKTNDKLVNVAKIVQKSETNSQNLVPTQLNYLSLN